MYPEVPNSTITTNLSIFHRILSLSSIQGSPLSFSAPIKCVKNTFKDQHHKQTPKMAQLTNNAHFCRSEKVTVEVTPNWAVIHLIHSEIHAPLSQEWGHSKPSCVSASVTGSALLTQWGGRKPTREPCRDIQRTPSPSKFMVNQCSLQTYAGSNHSFKVTSIKLQSNVKMYYIIRPL